MELRNLYSLPDITRLFESRIMGMCSKVNEAHMEITGMHTGFDQKAKKKEITMKT
jgi:hypothetical protein